MTLKCAACGLPPRRNKRLLQCTRCKTVYYHDRKCQQNHYPKHKAECRRVAAAADKARKSGGAVCRVKPLVRCESIAGRGRSLIANSPLAVGCHPLLAAANDGLCEPTAHPVLIESMRASRCAFCFQPIQTSSANGRALHNHCSPECRNLDKNWMVEMRAMQNLPSPPSPTALSCSRLLRKFQESPAALKEYNELCWDVSSLSEEEKISYLSIMTQCHLFLRAMEDAATAKMAHGLLHPDTAPAYRFMSRLSMNGFTISTSEQLAVGHGVYCGASAINHSCRPNAVPTFWLRDSAPPALQVTVCQRVSAGEEVTIGYCDLSTPRRMRRESLWKNYKFVCDCSLCADLDRDDSVVGLKCTNAGCKGRVKSIPASGRNGTCLQNPTLIEGNTENQERYRCDVCENDDFHVAMKVRASSMKKLNRFQSAFYDVDASDGSCRKATEETKRIYERLKGHHSLETSYYTAWSAHLFVHWCADALKSYAGERDRVDACREALAAINESRSASKFCFEYPGNLSWHINRGVEAKLRLFANPMDLDALGMLGDVRKELAAYYPPSDDIITSLEESLAAYSFS